jgi:hypothetical protein
MTSKLAFTVLAALLLAAGAHAGDKPSPQELLDAAHKASDLSAFGPYVLTGTLAVNPGTKKELTGSLAVYRDGDRARVDVVIGNRSDTRITIGNKDYVDPERILLSGTWLEEFDRIWDPERPRLASGLRRKWASVRKQKIAGAEAWCLERENELFKEHMCFDAERRVLLSSTFVEFSNHTTVGVALIPQTIKITDSYSAPVEVRNIKIAPYPAEAALFEISAHAMELENCLDHEPPKLLNAPMPARSRLSQRATNGQVALFMFVDQEGKVASIRILTVVQADYNARIQDTIRKWSFKPATCGGHPVNDSFTVTANGSMF